MPATIPPVTVTSEKCECGCLRTRTAAAFNALPVIFAAQVTSPPPATPGTDVLSQILQFIYTIAHALGGTIVATIQRIVPQAKIPLDLVDPIGFLSVLTIFVLLAGLARRLAWIIVGIGWLLIAVRIALVLLGR